MNYILHGQTHSAPALNAGFYVVATPIGNLKDITLRALETLAACEIILCEDTRNSVKLLSAYGIKAKLIALHDHNEAEMRPKIQTWLNEGKAIALISDAGTPLIADPGFKLVRDLETRITPIPGSCAFVTLLMAAGLPTDSFYFDGFLPSKQQARSKRIKLLLPLQATLIFYETAPRLLETLAELHTQAPLREVAIGRELTKTFEEVKRGTAAQLIAYYETHILKGELVLALAPPPEVTAQDIDLESLILPLLKTKKAKEIAAFLAEQTGLSKRDIYQKVLELAKKSA
jgi:16S rRNA (cytidine1402-2'-O)-methyltransferase